MLTTVTDDVLSCAQLRLLGRYAPAMLCQLEDDLGADAMRRLAVTYGGTVISIPVRSTKKTVITERCGLEIAKWLTNTVGHGKVMVPLGPASRSNRNLVAMVRMLADGVSKSEIARRSGISYRTLCVMHKRLRDQGVDLAAFLEETSHDHQ